MKQGELQFKNYKFQNALRTTYGLSRKQYVAGSELMPGTPPYWRPMMTLRQSCCASRPCCRISTKSGFSDL